MKLSIPTPCHEDWNKMQPEEQGRHCQACSKMVVDFTTWEPEAIRDYMMQRRGENVCGRFTVDQVATTTEPETINWPMMIAQSGLSIFKKVAAVIIVVFGLSTSSCKSDEDKLKDMVFETSFIEGGAKNKVDSGVDKQQSGSGDSIAPVAPQKFVKKKKAKEANDTIFEVMGNITIDGLNARVNGLLEEIEKRRNLFDSTSL